MTRGTKIALALGGAALVGGVIYFATRSSPAQAATAPGPAGPALGSKENPYQLPPGQIVGPQDAWAIRLTNGQAELGQFSQPIRLFGTTQYRWVMVSASPLPPSAVVSLPPAPATPTVDQAAQFQAAEAASNAASASAGPTAPPPGTTFGLFLDGNKSIQLQVGQTVGLQFPPSSCGVNWQVQQTVTEGTNPATLPVSTPNVLLAVAAGQADFLYSCGGSQRMNLHITVLAPGGSPPVLRG